MKKHRIIVIGILMLFMPLSIGAFTAEHQGCSGDCKDCHMLEIKDAEAIVEKLKKDPNFPPDARVSNVRLSPVGGLWQIEMETGKGRGALYIDFSRKYLISGQIIPLEAISNSAQKRKIDFTKIPLKDAIVLGLKKAGKKVAVFTDPDCPHCRNLHFEIKKVLGRRNDVAFYIFFNPLPKHPDAYKKTQAILCEKSTEMLDNAYAGLMVPDPRCSNEQVEKGIALAKKLGFGGTPTLVRDDGAVMGGYLPADKLIEWIDGK